MGAQQLWAFCNEAIVSSELAALPGTQGIQHTLGGQKHKKVHAPQVSPEPEPQSEAQNPKTMFGGM